MGSGIPSLVVSVPDERLARDLQPLPDGVELLMWDMTSAPPRDRIDIVVPPYLSAARILPLLTDVETRLVQSQSIGYEGVVAHLPPGTTFANAATVHETSTAELALGLTIAAQRRIPDFVRAQAEGRWMQSFSPSLADRKVLLLGYGGVGKAIAARLEPFEVELTVVAHTAREEDGIRIYGIDELPALLPQTEIVILTLPGGESTKHIIDGTVMDALPDGALIVNVGRGSLVDTDALVDHVSQGRLRAALDVMDPEPLPADHPLWSLPGVLIAPHVGGASTAMEPRIARLVRRQIDRLLRGEPPVNVVLTT